MLVKFKTIAVVPMLCAISLSSMAADNPKDLKDKASYSIGVNVGNQLGQSRDDIDLDKFIEGFKDSFTGKQPRLAPAEMQQALKAFSANLQKKRQQQQQVQAKNNKAAGDAFLAENKKRKGVITLPSGLQYQVIQAGKGASPKATDTVVTHYHGTLINGTVFDSSIERGQPATFPVSRVIKGWTEALQKMKVGAKWKIFVPSQLAYGPAGSPPKIGPNTTLVFDIELIDIKK